MSDHDEPRLGEFLSGLREKGDGFRVPSPDYLDELTNRALSQGRNPVPVRTMARTRWAAAAAVMLLLLATFLLLPTTDGKQTAADDTTKQPSSEMLLADLDAEDIDAYISDQLDDFESELYANAPVNE
ncbi:hypothetical protein [Neolewinella persica]|uniref:hypothetical protein n=1 Tax=Neolewinella persica TaxID=70998 RepID=UPI0003729F6A|nr:hypothetical protein [Neolewinella persica]